MEHLNDDHTFVPPKNLEEFLEHFFKNYRNDDFISLKYGNYEVTLDEIAGETVNWTLQYLQYMSCPSHLESGITRAVLEETKSQYPSAEAFEDQVDSGGRSHKHSFKSMHLLQNVTSTVNEVCKKLKEEKKDKQHKMAPEGRVVPCAISSVKNGRKKMEDRYVAIHDLNVVYGDQYSQVSNGPPMSFYAVYDGHCGKEAAAFAASQLHGYMLASRHYPENLVEAIREAFEKTDQSYLDKEGEKCGTTAVCTLICENQLYSAWLGDSQTILVRNGRPVEMVNPHKPNRPDEKKRIEDLGGAVIHWGSWRVNGQLAVSRAIGDRAYKPYVSSLADVTVVKMNGSEDFLILACDGLWDTVTPLEATETVFECLKKNPENLDSVSNALVALAKDNGSTDNITIIIVFLRPIAELIKLEPGRSSQDNLREGITSTAYFSANPNWANMNGNSDDAYDDEPQTMMAKNPFGSPAVFHENGQGSGTNNNQSFFDSPSGGAVFGDSPNPFASAAAADPENFQATDDMEFKRASPSMFDQSLPSPGVDDDDDKPGHDQVDFMANQQQSWMTSAQMSGKPGDSGFISPASACRNDSEESRGHNQSDDINRENESRTNDEDDEMEESREVTELLAKISGGQLPQEMIDIQRKSSTPEKESSEDEEEDNTPLEDILAAARNRPETTEVDQEEDEDSSNSDEDEEEQGPPATAAPQLPKEDQENSDEDEEEGGFTFVKSVEEPKEDNSLQPSQTEEVKDRTEEVISSEAKDSELISGLETSFKEKDQEEAQEAVEMSNASLSMAQPNVMELEKQPSSVIVASQEVPEPDQASFILKPSDEQGHAMDEPQSAVKEVLGDERSSPIPEEVEEKPLSLEKSDQEPHSGADMFEDQYQNKFSYDESPQRDSYQSQVDHEVDDNEEQAQVEPKENASESEKIGEPATYEENIHTDDFDTQVPQVPNISMEITTTQTVEEETSNVENISNDHESSLEVPSINLIPPSPNTSINTQEGEDNVDREAPEADKLEYSAPNSVSCEIEKTQESENEKVEEERVPVEEVEQIIISQEPEGNMNSYVEENQEQKIEQGHRIEESLDSQEPAGESEMLVDLQSEQESMARSENTQELSETLPESGNINETDTNRELEEPQSKPDTESVLVPEINEFTEPKKVEETEITQDDSVELKLHNDEKENLMSTVESDTMNLTEPVMEPVAIQDEKPVDQLGTFNDESTQKTIQDQTELLLANSTESSAAVKSITEPEVKEEKFAEEETRGIAKSPVTKDVKEIKEASKPTKPEKKTVVKASPTPTGARPSASTRSAPAPTVSQRAKPSSPSKTPTARPTSSRTGTTRPGANTGSRTTPTTPRASSTTTTSRPTTGTARPKPTKDASKPTTASTTAARRTLTSTTATKKPEAAPSAKPKPASATSRAPLSKTTKPEAAAEKKARPATATTSRVQSTASKTAGTSLNRPSSAKPSSGTRLASSGPSKPAATNGLANKKTPTSTSRPTTSRPTPSSGTSAAAARVAAARAAAAANRPTLSNKTGAKATTTTSTKPSSTSTLGAAKRPTSGTGSAGTRRPVGTKTGTTTQSKTTKPASSSRPGNATTTASKSPKKEAPVKDEKEVPNEVENEENVPEVESNGVLVNGNEENGEKHDARETAEPVSFTESAL